MAITLGAFTVAAIANCAGFKHRLKASVDNADMTYGIRDDDGKLSVGPQVSIPVWSSKPLKAKPQEITPDGTMEQY